MAKTASIGRISVDLDLNSAKFSQKLRKAQKDTGGFSKAMKQMRGAANMFGKVAVAGIGAAGGAIAALAVKTAAASDAAAKMADTLGIQYEALQELQYAAGQSGVSVESFNGSLQKMSRRIEFASRGTGAAKKAFEDLGLSAEDLAKMAPEKQLEVIADRFADIQDPAERSAYAFEIFGQQGRAMVKMLEGGSAGLIEARERAQQFGHVITRDVARNLENFNDNMDNMGRHAEGFGNQLVSQMAPAMQVMSERADEFIIAMGGMGKIGEEVGAFVTKAIGAIGDSIQGMAFLWDGATYAAQAFYVAILEGINAVTTPVMQFSRDFIRMMLKPLLDASEVIGTFDAEWGAALDAMKARLDSPVEPIISDEYVQEQRDQLGVLETEFTSWAGTQQFSEKFKADLETTKAAVKETVAEMNETFTSDYQGPGSQAWQDSQAKDAEQLSEINTQKKKDNIDWVASSGSALGQMAQLQSSHNSKMAAIGKTASIGQTIQATYESATQSYKAMAGIPIVGPALGVAAAAAAVASGMANVAKIKAGRATGGPVEAGTPYMIGERGQSEVFVPEQDGYINNDPSRMGGGGTTINISAMDAKGVDRVMRKYMRRNGKASL